MNYEHENRLAQAASRVLKDWQRFLDDEIDEVDFGGGALGELQVAILPYKSQLAQTPQEEK